MIRLTDSPKSCAKPRAATRADREENPMRRTSKFRLLMLAAVAVLPSFLKRPAYRLFFGYRIGKRVRIGLTIIDAGICEI